MDRHTSVYLDAARLCAALLVVAGHTEWNFAPGFLPFVRSGHLATLAVGVFFVLSGFVIGYTVNQKERDALNYFVNRAARIYSVVVPALALTLAVDTLGEWIVPDAYNSSLSALHFLKDVVRDFISLSFINGVWQWNLIPGTNAAYWSMAYEV
jgi:peptidoglycan/LPS O-acetylase OafA/YrhL